MYYVMKKDQLFAKIPPYDLFIKILKCFGLDNINDKRSFTRKHLTYINTVQKMEELVPKLKLYYIPCKARTYLNNLTEKNVVTILRQILKTQQHSLNSREKYVKGSKFIIYNICKIEEKKYTPIINMETSKKIESNKPIVITFN